MNVIFFKTSADFRKWLEIYHKTEKEIWVGYYKTSLKKEGITWPQSVDEAICFGWIDGIRKSIDNERYCNRFTPRKANSNWSAVNIKKAGLLSARGLMHPSGLEMFQKRKDDKSEVYSYENRPEILSGELEQKFRSNEKASAFFSAQAPFYRKTVLYWIMSAKQEKTRINRLSKLIEACETGKKLYQ